MKTILILDNNQKLLVYKKTLVKLEADLQNGNRLMGLCWNISNSAKVLGYTDHHGETAYGLNMKRNFPELYKYKPLKREWFNNHFWFSLSVEGTEKRIVMLKKAIKKLEVL